jgi:hypothetical protein
VSSYDAALAIVEKLTGAGVTATADPRSATPPCVLVTPPDRVYDLACGYTASWSCWALVPGVGNADAHKALDALVDAVAEVLPVERVTLQSYVLASDAPALPAYRIQFDEGVSQ